MALAQDAQTTYLTTGNREDLTDFIYDISPTATPFMNGVARATAKLTLHEWQTDTLAAAAANQQLEGDDPSTDVVVATVRLGNRTQISTKTPRVTGTQEVVVSAGRKSEMRYRIFQASRELKRDMEFALLQNGAAVTGNGTTARVLAGLLSWVATNDDFGAGGASPTGDNTDSRTDGTQRAVTEAQLKTVLAAAWEAGGNPDCILVGSFVKQEMSTFGGNATRYIGAGERRLEASIDLYDSDFGELEIKPDHFSRGRDAWVLETRMWAVAYLRTFRLMDLAKTGDSDHKHLLVEFSLEARSEASGGLIADLNTA